MCNENADLHFHRVRALQVRARDCSNRNLCSVTVLQVHGPVVILPVSRSLAFYSVHQRETRIVPRKLLHRMLTAKALANGVLLVGVNGSL